MEQHFFRYQILRYIADLKRMEPENIGVIIQDAREASYRFRTHMGKRPGFDADNYRQWREFFEAEINGPPVPVYQPPRGDIAFLQYLQQRCCGNYSLTRPLELTMPSDALGEVRDHLFRTLVLKPEEQTGDAKQPVRRLRNELRERKITSNPHFHERQLFNANGITELVEYYYVRNHGANLPVIIQPVQILPDISRTINAMERAEALVKTLRAARVKTEISIVVDEMSPPKRDDSDKQKWAYDHIIKGKRQLEKYDADVVDSTRGTVKLADNIERDLSEIETPKSQPELSFA